MNTAKKPGQKFNVSPQLFQSVADAMEGIVFVKDTEGIYQFINNEFCRVVNLSRNDIIGKDDSSIFSPEATAQFQEHDKRIIQSKTKETIIEKLEVRDEILTYRLSRVPLINEKGEVYGICGNGFDIIQGIKQKDGVKSTENFFDNVVNNSLDSIILTNHDGKIIRVNRALEELTGYAKEELIGISPQFFRPQKEGTYQTTLGETIEIDRKAISRANDRIAQFIKKGSFQSVDSFLIRKDGKLVPVEINIVMLFGDNGKRIGTVANVKDVSRYKESEKKLQQANFFLDSIIQNSLDCILVTDITGQLVRVNKAVLDLFGYTKDEIIEKTAHEFLSAEKGIYESSSGGKVEIDDHILKTGKEMIAELFEKGEVTNREMYCFTKNKKAIPVEHNAVFFENEKGERIGVVSIIRDITERKKAENEIKKHRDHLNEQVKQKTKELSYKNEQLVANYEQLLASEKSLIENEEKLRAIVRTASDAIITTNPSGDISSWNEAAEKIFGYKEEEMLGKSALLIIPERLRKEQLKQAAEATRNPDSLRLKKQIELIGQRKNGKEFPMEFSGSMWKIEEHTYYTSIIRDIAQKKQSEQEILETRDFLENIFNTSADGIIVTDELGYIVRINKALGKMTGYTEKELLQIHVKDLAPEYKGIDDITISSEPVKKLKTGIRISDHQVLWQRKDKSLFPVETSMSLLKDKAENITGGVGIVRDITERQKIEDQLLRSEKLKSLGELAGGVAHDFNNVLAAILGRAQLLKRKVEHLNQDELNTEINIEINKGLDVIEEAALDGAETIRRIQEFARKRSDDKNFIPVDLYKIIKGALEFTKTRWKDDSELKGYKYSVKTLFSSLPPIEGSPSELREVFVNLINNSLDAMPKGGIISLSSELKNNRIKIKFKDTGKGINPEVMDRIFDPFFTTKGPQSTGLGMSVSFGIINRHNGSINVESEVGKGTLFTIIFPISGKGIESEEHPKKIVQTRKAKVLIADDEKEVLNVIKDLLILEGHQVETANNGKEAVEIFSKKEFDLVFTDLGMPGMSGWEIADKIKKIKNVPVILMTGWEIKNNEITLNDKKIDFLVSKPFKIAEILKAVNKGLELKDNNC